MKYNRRHFLAIAGVSLVGTAGCVGPFATSDDISDRFDCQDADRPQPDVEQGITHSVSNGEEVEYESIGSVAYPDQPRSTAESDVVNFVEQHEEAYLHNEQAASFGDELTGFSADFDRILVIESDDVTVIRLDVHYFADTFTSEGEPVNMSGETGVVYAVDESGAVRVETDFMTGMDEEAADAAPDPLDEGELVVCFE